MLVGLPTDASQSSSGNLARDSYESCLLHKWKILMHGQVKGGRLGQVSMSQPLRAPISLACLWILPASITAVSLVQGRRLSI